MKQNETTVANQAHYIKEQELKDKQRNQQEALNQRHANLMQEGNMMQAHIQAQQAVGYYGLQQQQGGGWGHPFTDNPNPWERETYEDWLEKSGRKKKPKEPQNQVEDEVIDSMRKEIQAIQASAIILTKKLAEIKCREQSVISRENRLESQDIQIAKRYNDLHVAEKEAEERNIELEDLELNLVEREAVVEEWEKLHATPNTTSGEPNDVRKRTGRL